MNISNFLKGLFGGGGDEKPLGMKPTFDHSLIEHLKRPCWFPEVEDGDGSITASKFAGIPYLPPNETWPICPNCENPLQLFLQLNSDDLPEASGKPWGDGLLQFFYCTNAEPMCEVDCQAWAPFARSTVLRVIAAGKDHSTYEESPVINAFPPKRIVGWTETDDAPNWEELRSSGLDLDDAQMESISEIYPKDGEKLLGWPYWVQSIEYPNCPKCDSQMELVFQIDSDKSVPYAWGDVGMGHITRCPQHPTELAFGWACH